MNRQNSIEEILDFCIERLRKGESQQAILADYPAYRDDLEPHLSLAGSLLKFPRIEPDDSAMHRTIFSMGAASTFSEEKSFKPRRFRTILSWAAGIILLVGLTGYITVNIAQASLPGDFLYPFKLATERVKLALIRSPEGEAEMRISLSERRLQEVIATAAQGQEHEAVLSAMLDEAQRAINNAEQLQGPQRDVVLSRVQYLSGYQQNVLESLLPRVPADKQEHFQKAINQCKERWNWCCEMGMRNREVSQPPHPSTDKKQCNCPWCK
jgi:hypothetical protein